MSYAAAASKGPKQTPEEVCQISLFLLSCLLWVFSLNVPLSMLTRSRRKWSFFSEASEVPVLDQTHSLEIQFLKALKSEEEKKKALSGQPKFSCPLIFPS